MRQSPEREAYLSTTKTSTNLRSSAAKQFLEKNPSNGRPRLKSMHTDKSVSFDRSMTSNPVLKSGVTAEDLANRLLAHKLRSEKKVQEQQRQKEAEL